VISLGIMESLFMRGIMYVSSPTKHVLPRFVVKCPTVESTRCRSLPFIRLSEVADVCKIA
jgi:hypothetical protein